MKHLLLSVLLVVGVSTLCRAQSYPVTRADTSGRSQLLFLLDDCTRAAALAEHDIQAKIPYLIAGGGIAPAIYPTDAPFQQQFGVRYFVDGCTSAELACVLAYNHRVFDYLQATYGSKWQRTVRRDVVGYKEWRRKH